MMRSDNDDYRRCRWSSPAQSMVDAGVPLPNDYAYNRPLLCIGCHAPALRNANTPGACTHTDQQASCSAYEPDPGELLMEFRSKTHTLRLVKTRNLHQEMLVITEDDRTLFQHPGIRVFDPTNVTLAESALQTIAALFDDMEPVSVTVPQSKPFFEEILP